MSSPVIAQEEHTTWFFRPSLRLQPYIQCYWLSMHNQASHYHILPDGCVDLVFDLLLPAAQSLIYGTTTSKQDIDIRPHTHYLGIRFQAGQSRHFIHSAALELTNSHCSADQLLKQDIQPVFEQLAAQIALHCIEHTMNNCHYLEMTNRLNQHFEHCLSRHAPLQLAIDQAICHIEQSAGQQRIQTINSLQALSSRQCERLFKQHVGISAKQYAAICRFQHASRLVLQGNSLVNSALTAGFSDQSHFNHDIKKLTGLTPRQFFQQHVVFLQDQQSTKE